MSKQANLWHVLVLILLFLLLFPKPFHEPILDLVQLHDDGGRLITLPPSISKIYTTTESGLFLIYALDPDSILGWNRGLSPQLEFAIQPQYHNLPTLGTWDQRYQTIHLDRVVELQPDLIIHYATPNEVNRLLATEIEDTLNIPTLLVDNSLQALPGALRLLGQLLGKEVRGQALATFVEKRLGRALSFQELQASYNPIPVHIVSGYEPGHFDELLRLAGMIEMPIWNSEPPLPDYVLVMPNSITDPYRNIEKDGYKRIYQIPSFPLNWLEPGSIFGLLGLEWLHSIGYPTSYSVDFAETYRAFMEIFFEVKVTSELLAWTLQRSGISY